MRVIIYWDGTDYMIWYCWFGIPFLQLHGGGLQPVVAASSNPAHVGLPSGSMWEGLSATYEW